LIIADKMALLFFELRLGLILGLVAFRGSSAIWQRGGAQPVNGPQF
jgi:hypothetical protein